MFPLEKVSILERCLLQIGFSGNEIKLISEADFGIRNIPLTTNLILISMLFGLSIKAGEKIGKKTKFLPDVSMSTVACVP